MTKTFLIFTFGLILFAGCKKELHTPNNNEIDYLNINSPYTFIAEVDGKKIEFTDYLNCHVSAGGTKTPIKDSFRYIIKSYFNKSQITSDKHLEFNKAIYPFGDNLSNPEFKIQFLPGEHPYFEKEKNNGFEFIYYENDTAWSTDFGNQSGSMFKITDTKEGFDSSISKYYIKAKILFSCKVYTETGKMKIVKNGQAVVWFANLFEK